MVKPLPLPQVRMPVGVPSLLLTGEPPLQVNSCLLRPCRNRGAVGGPSRIWKSPSPRRSSEKVLCSPQCTQSRLPSVVRFTRPGTSARDTATEPRSGGGLVLDFDGAGDDGGLVLDFDGVGDGDSGASSEALGSGIGNCSPGLIGRLPSAGGCAGGIASCLS